MRLKDLWYGIVPRKPRYRFTKNILPSGFVTYATFKRDFSGYWTYVPDSCYHDKEQAYTVFERITTYGPRFTRDEVLEERF